jgi:DNA-binding LytR/AlgR family response regulator
MIRVAVCDDDRPATGLLESLILEAQNSLPFSLEVTIFSSGESFCKAIEDGCPYDIILMDIEMEGLSGIQAGHTLRADCGNDASQLIYISSHQEYHLQLFDVQPSGFIGKPVDPEAFHRKLSAAVERAVLKRSQGQKRFFPIQQKGKETLVPLKDIIYLESRIRKVLLHSRTGVFEYYSTLNEEEEKLPGSDFVRIHQSYMVNYSCIREIGHKKVVLLNGVELPVSAKQGAALKKNYLRFRGNLVG